MLPSVTKPQSPISNITVALNDIEAQTRLRKSFDGKLEPANFLCRRNVEAVENADAVLFAFPPENLHEFLAKAEMRKALGTKS